MGVIVNEKQSKLDIVLSNQLLQEEALYHFTQGELEKFDALVGEQACQIRASMISDMYEKYAIHLKDNNLITRFTTQERETLLLSYFLTKFQHKEAIAASKKTIHERFKLQEVVRLDLPQVMTFFQVPKNQADLIIHATQVKLAELSLAYLFMITDSKLHHAPHIEPLLHQQHSICGRPAIGCYVSIVLAYYNALESNRPIVIKINRLCKEQNKSFTFFFKPQDKHQYQPTTMEQDFMDHAALIIEGISVCSNPNCQGCLEQETFLSTWNKALEKHGLFHMLCANAAQHKQFVGNEDISYDFSTTIDFGKKFTHDKEVAEQEGYSFNNPSTLLIKHIYANKLSLETHKLDLAQQVMIH